MRLGGVELVMVVDGKVVTEGAGVYGFRGQSRWRKQMMRGFLSIDLFSSSVVFSEASDWW